MWEEGKASGPAVEADFDAVLDEARQEIASAAPYAR
jgi:antitoxin ParD1/3/4